MAKKRKTYTITVSGGWMTHLVRELNMWCVPSTSYAVVGNVITTKSTNVVDVVTETFFRRPELVTITLSDTPPTSPQP